jgi:cell division protease FtsH
VPRGKALGVTVFLPEKDKVSVKKSELLDQMRTLYGGRIAEEIIYGTDNISTGASNDIERATLIATKMVKDWGMSSLGAIHIDDNINQYGEKRTYSQNKLDLIDTEIKSILDKCYAEAYEIVNNNKDKLETMKDILIEKETINKKVVEQIIFGT